MMNKETNMNSWTWYKAWINTLIRPSEDTWIALLSEGNVSFRRAYVWLIFTSVLFPLAYTITVWIDSPLSINSNTASVFVRNIVLIGIFEPVFFVVLTGIIHFLAKLFSKSGNYSNFFIVFAASYAPISLLRTVTTIVRWLFAFKIGLYAGVILIFYFLAFILTQIINFNYQVNLVIAFLISVGVAFLAYYMSMIIYVATGFGI